MRRSLAGIVPDEILHRKRKAYVTRAPRAAIAAHWLDLQSLTHGMLAESLGIVSAAAFRRALDEIRHGKELSIVPIHRMLLLECWLRNLLQWGVLPHGPRNVHAQVRAFPQRPESDRETSSAS